MEQAACPREAVPGVVEALWEAVASTETQPQGDEHPVETPDRPLPPATKRGNKQYRE